MPIYQQYKYLQVLYGYSDRVCPCPWWTDRPPTRIHTGTSGVRVLVQFANHLYDHLLCYIVPVLRTYRYGWHPVADARPAFRPTVIYQLVYLYSYRYIRVFQRNDTNPTPYLKYRYRSLYFTLSLLELVPVVMVYPVYTRTVCSTGTSSQNIRTVLVQVYTTTVWQSSTVGL